MKPHSFLIIHGLGGSGSDHWQTWLARELTKREHRVYYPTFTREQAPDLNTWIKELDDCLKTIPADHELTVITHSLGCLLWLHYTAQQQKPLAKQVILVAPPSPTHTLLEAKSFFPVPLDRNHLITAAEHTLFVHSTNDPYCCMDEAQNFLSLSLPSIVFPHYGHINPASGHGKWPWILEQCLAIGKIAL